MGERLLPNNAGQGGAPIINNEISVVERKTLVQSGFTNGEITSLLGLRQWYGTGGSDRVPIVRHLEFLKLLVISGKMEL